MRCLLFTFLFFFSSSLVENDALAARNDNSVNRANPPSGVNSAIKSTTSTKRAPFQDILTRRDQSARPYQPNTKPDQCTDTPRKEEDCKQLCECHYCPCPNSKGLTSDGCFYRTCGGFGVTMCNECKEMETSAPAQKNQRKSD